VYNIESPSDEQPLKKSEKNAKENTFWYVRNMSY
jgi:hypothetical protein